MRGLGVLSAWRGNEKADEIMQQDREEVYVALQYAASFHCLVEEWKDCEELRPKPKEKLIFVDPQKRGDETSEWCAAVSKYRVPH